MKLLNMILKFKYKILLCLNLKSMEYWSKKAINEQRFLSRLISQREAITHYNQYKKYSSFSKYASIKGEYFRTELHELGCKI